MNTENTTDIKPDSLMLRFLPPSVKPYALLARLDRPIGIWLLLLPGWWAVILASGGLAAMGLREWTLMALFAAGSVVMRAAGCVINDLWDRKLDQQVARTQSRPLASGALSPRQALIFLAGLLALGLLILLQMNGLTIMLGVLTLPLIILYPLMKRITWWPQAFLGLTFNFGILMGWSAVTGDITLSPILLYIGGIFWTLGYDTIYALQDQEDDALAGIKSTARLFGKEAHIAIMLFYIAAWFFIDAGMGRAPAAGSWMFLCAAPAGLHLFWQVRSLRARSPLAIFRSNRDFGLLVLAGIVIGTAF